MSDVKREIEFKESMTIDKRNGDFAYLLKNVFPSRSKGLYPAAQFVQERPDDILSTEDIEDILGSEEGSYDIKVIIRDGSDLRFSNLGSNSESNDPLNGVDYECGAFGEDGVYIATDDDNVYKVQHANSNTTSEGLFTDARPDIAGFDGLNYWWLSSNEIYKQLPSNAPTVAFNNLGIQPRFVDFFNDQMVIFCQQAADIVILFWDKTDTDLFDKRVVVKNARLIAGGVVDGTLMLVKGVGNSSNLKERNGEIVICGYDGEKFARMNSIKAGDNDVEYEDEKGVAVGSEIMMFSVQNNNDSHNPELYENYIYKVKKDGQIEAQTLPDSTYGDVHIVRIFYNFSLYATRGSGANEPRIYTNESNSDSYSQYDDFDDTVYITNFLNNPYNLHKLDSMNFTFEKLFRAVEAGPPERGEKLEVYYRVSERDSFTLLCEIDSQKVFEQVNRKLDMTTEYNDSNTGLPAQSYQVTEGLPDYNEIQFKFVTKRGFSLIGCWYGYTYITNNTLK